MKVKAGTGTGSGGKKGSSSEDESPICPLRLVDFEVLDIEKSCPRFHSVTSRSEEEGVGLEDLDTLQTELESMLVSVIQRRWNIEHENDQLSFWNESNNSRSHNKINKSSPGKSTSVIDGKRKISRTEIENPETPKSKKSRGDVMSPLSSSTSSISSCSSSAIGATGKKLSTSKSKSKNLPFKFHSSEVDPVKNNVSRNDLPDRFAAFIEPYCSPIKPEDIITLEDMLKNYEESNLDEYYKVPNLGKHYTIKWSLNEVEKTPATGKSKKSAAAKIKEEPKDGEEETVVSTPSKKGKKAAERNSNFGPLTQRLLQAMLETPSDLGDAMTCLDDNSEDEKKGSKDQDGDNKKDKAAGSPAKSAGSPAKSSRKKVTKALNLGNTSQLEKRIKKELEEAGLLELDDGSAHVDHAAEDDEILRELIKTQNELRMISSQNESQLRLLLSKAHLDVKKQELESKLKVIDEEVIDCYRKLCSAKSKKKIVTKKEKDQALKALKDRDQLIQEIDSLNL